MSDVNIARCPLCNYPDVYLGATKVECGYDEVCANWTRTQADEVERLTAERYPTPAPPDVTPGESSQFSLDWDRDEDVTPSWPIPDFTTD